MKPIDVLLLSRNDVVGLALSPVEVVSAIEGALLEHAAGTYEMHPKIGVHPIATDPANFIHAMPALPSSTGRLRSEVGRWVRPELPARLCPT